MSPSFTKITKHVVDKHGLKVQQFYLNRCQLIKNKRMNKAYQLDGIHYCYGNTFELFLPKLEIRTHKITTLIGANGSGKSTLLNLLALLELPQKGALKFFGDKVSLKQQYVLRKQIGFLPQKPYMFRGSVTDNLNLVLKLHQIPKIQRKNKIMLILKQLNLVKLREHQAKTLSGGELQQVAFARALITQPKVLLMDEPFSYLDQANVQLLEHFILNYVKEQRSTLVFSTHYRLQGLAIADDVVSLVKGRQIESPLVNLFNGVFEKGYFKTAYLCILATESAESAESATHISIDPRKIVLSTQRLNSSMRNQYQGRVTAIIEETGMVRVSVNTGDIFQVMITQEAFKLLELKLTDVIWLSFKANAVVVF